MLELWVRSVCLEPSEFITYIRELSSRSDVKIILVAGRLYGAVAGEGVGVMKTSLSTSLITPFSTRDVGPIVGVGSGV